MLKIARNKSSFSADSLRPSQATFNGFRVLQRFRGLEFLYNGFRVSERFRIL